MPAVCGTDSRPRAASTRAIKHAASCSTSRPGTQRARIAKPGTTPTANLLTKLGRLPTLGNDTSHVKPRTNWNNGSRATMNTQVLRGQPGCIWFLLASIASSALAAISTRLAAEEAGGRPTGRGLAHPSQATKECITALHHVLATIF